MNTYIEQLKAKYSNPQKAYIYYALSKTLLHHVQVSEDAPKEIKDIIEIQNILNDYCENFIEQESYKELHEFFGFSKEQELIDFIFTDQNFEKLNFLEIKYEFRDSVLSGIYQKTLKEKSKNFTWSSLEDLVIKENNNSPKLVEHTEINSKLNNLINDFGLVSITIGNVKIEDQLIDKLYKSLEQLSIALDCNKKHIGLNKLNLCLDCNDEIDFCAGRVGRFKSKNFTLYLNSSVMDDLFAHEWFHFLDNVIAHHNHRHIYGEDTEKYIMYETSLNPSFKDLFDKSDIKNPNSFIDINENKIFTHIQNIIDKQSKLNTVNNAEALKAFIQKEFDKKTFSKVELIDGIQKFQSNKNTGLVPYILSEIEILKYGYGKSDNLSLFITYAIRMDKNMRLLGLLEEKDTYSITYAEMAARIFESYVDVKLKEKGFSNIISQSEYNFYSPQKDELKFYINDFELLLNDMKKTFNQIYPISDKCLLVDRMLSLRENKEAKKDKKFVH